MIWFSNQYMAGRCVVVGKQVREVGNIAHPNAYAAVALTHPVRRVRLVQRLRAQRQPHHTAVAAARVELATVALEILGSSRLRPLEDRNGVHGREVPSIKCARRQGPDVEALNRADLENMHACVRVGYRALHVGLAELNTGDSRLRPCRRRESSRWPALACLCRRSDRAA